MVSEGRLAPAHPDFLQGCGLPAAWARQPHWRILETAFGCGLNFLAAWQAWKGDEQRPRILHFVAIDDSPAAAADLLLAAHPWPQLRSLAQALARQWYGLLPGVHRLVFEQGHVLLTLCVGEANKMLRELDFHADSVFLGGVEELRHRPSPAEPLNLKALARRCRRGTAIAAVDPGGELGPALLRHGFTMRQDIGCTAASDLVCGEFAPAWEPRGPRPKAPVVPADCIVIGAGLAGAAAAASLARRGWQVQVLDAARSPASGASGLPAGVLVPHSSPDDNLLSRLSRDGVRATLQQAQALLEPDVDWACSGVFEHRLEGPTAAPTQGSAAAAVWSRPADAQQKQLAGLDDGVAAQWHEQAGWIRPERLVQAWLAQPGVHLHRNAKVAKLVREGNQWHAVDGSGLVLARGELVIVAAAFASDELVEGLALQPVRGQISWALHDAQLRLPPFPVNGDGSFIPSVPMAEGLAWLCGSSFDRGDVDRDARGADDQANFARLARLLPGVARQLASAFAGGSVQAWTGIRCASADRRPLVGPLDEHKPDGPWLCTAMGSRGLTFAALCGELIAARLHGEPLPIARNLARAISAARPRKTPVGAAESRANAGE